MSAVEGILCVFAVMSGEGGKELKTWQESNSVMVIRLRLREWNLIRRG